MPKKNNKIYLDYAATTPVDGEVLKAMMPYFSEKFGNSSSIHSFGQEAITAIDQAREKIARYFSCDFTEIIFTGLATESNNLAIKGLVQKYNYTTFQRSSVSGRNNFQKKHIITTTIEHESVLEPLKELEKAGHEITYLPVDKEGLLKISELEKAIKDNTILVSIIYANNEIGTIQPIKEIGKLLEKINKKRQENKKSKI
jgi:cysteine desulfurase